MIYVSSACVKSKTIEDSVTILSKNGFNHIELSGGTRFYDHSRMILKLIELKKNLNLNYIIHNYFPPPETPFVLNLASNDEVVFNETHKHLVNCLEYSNMLESKRFGFHAGFFFNIPLNEIGKKITVRKYDDFTVAYDIFCERYRKIEERAKEMGVKLYLENNVYSKSNFETYGTPAPAMLLLQEDFLKLNKEINFNLLLDVAHLKVSCQTLGHNFSSSLKTLANHSDYIHISDNDGSHDTNNALEKTSTLYEKLREIDFTDKIITLEVYESIELIKASYNNIKTITNA